MTNDSGNSIARELAETLLQMKRFGLHKKHNPDIRQSEIIMLWILVHSPNQSNGIKISDISTKMQITPAAVTHIMNTLVKRKYVERFGDPTDRRIVLIKATKKGIAVIESKKAILIQKWEELSVYLGQKDSSELIRLLNLTFGFFFKDKN
jgi:DNA-binding MarR family transcriptional regulator